MRDRLWRQSVICAMAAQLIAERSRLLDPDVAFVGGLMQNIGLLLLARKHPDIFSELEERCIEHQSTFYPVERELLGFDHADLAALVLSHWALGEQLIDAVAAHHRLEGTSEPEFFPAIVALAEELALRLGGGPTEERTDDLARLVAARRLSLDTNAFEEISEQLAQMLQDRTLLQF